MTLPHEVWGKTSSQNFACNLKPKLPFYSGAYNLKYTEFCQIFFSICQSNLLVRSRSGWIVFYPTVHCFWSSAYILLACKAGVVWGRANAIAAILDFKSRRGLGRVERATEGVGISLKGKWVANPTWRLRLTDTLALARLQKTPALQVNILFKH